MTPPKARRRQRSTRLTVAVLLITVAAGLVLGALVLRSSVVLAVAAVVAVALGAAATRITYAELVQSRRDANQDRAVQALAYRALAAERAVESDQHVRTLEGRIEQRESALRELEEALMRAQRRAAEAMRKRNVEARRADLAEQEGARLTSRFEDADERAAEAIVRLAELELEVDVLRSELSAWQAHVWTSAPADLRKHA